MASLREINKSIVLRDVGSVDSDTDIGSSSDLLPTSKWDTVLRYLYNPRDGTCCKRTSTQWITMLIYYIGYTAFIVLLFLGFLHTCVAIIKSLYPDYSIIDRDSLDTAHPGLGFVPNIVVTKYPIIWYSSDPSEDKTEDEYVKELDRFFAKYKAAKKEDYEDCSSSKNKTEKLCYFDMNSLEECNTSRYFYTNSSLCFFLKLNRRKNWKPIFYKTENDLPEEMSQSMLDHILDEANKEVIYVECLGKNLWDNEHMGQINYYPKQGFDGYYFPYKGEHEYLPPLVAVKMTGVTTGIVIHIQCTVWAKNIGHRLNHLDLKVFIDNTLPY